MHNQRKQKRQNRFFIRNKKTIDSLEKFYLCIFIFSHFMLKKMEITATESELEKYPIIRDKYQSDFDKLLAQIQNII